MVSERKSVGINLRILLEALEKSNLHSSKELLCLFGRGLSLIEGVIV
jgi:hypothetical protein